MTGELHLHERVIEKLAPLALGYSDLKLQLGLGLQPKGTRRIWRM